MPWTRICGLTLVKNLSVARYVEKNFTALILWPGTCRHTLGKNRIVVRSVEKGFPRSLRWQGTNKHILGKNFTIARYVERNIPDPMSWPRTCEHILGNNLFVSESVEKVFRCWHLEEAHVQSHTAVDKRFCCQTWENNIPNQMPWPCTCEHTVVKRYRWGCEPMLDEALFLPPVSNTVWLFVWLN